MRRAAPFVEPVSGSDNRRPGEDRAGRHAPGHSDGETATDSFTYTIRMGDGTYSTATVNALITGLNDPARIAHTEVTLVEGDSAGDLSTSGTVAIDDVDGPDSFVAGTQEGLYGTFTITRPATGPARPAQRMTSSRTAPGMARSSRSRPRTGPAPGSG